MTADFPFHAGQRFLIDDDLEHVHTVVCHRTAAGLALTTAGGLPVLYLPDTGKFCIPILGRYATRRT